jgi:hypothetical protein
MWISDFGMFFCIFNLQIFCVLNVLKFVLLQKKCPWFCKNGFGALNKKAIFVKKF